MMKITMMVVGRRVKRKIPANDLLRVVCQEILSWNRFCKSEIVVIVLVIIYRVQTEQMKVTVLKETPYRCVS